MKNKIDKKIYLFPISENAGESNPLTKFINFIKYQGGHWNRNFSFSGGFTTLHQELSFKDNLLLEAVPQTLTKTVEESMEEQFESMSNKRLLVLLKNYLKNDKKVSEFGIEDQQILSLIKAVIKTSDFIFLDAPEKNLNSFQLRIIKEILGHEVAQGRCLFIQSSDHDAWFDFCDYFIEQDNFEFVVRQNEFSPRKTA